MENTIYILPLGEVPPTDIAWLRGELEEELNMHCVSLQAQPSPAYAFNKDRRQFHASTILNRAPSMMPSDAMRLLMVTDVDLYAQGLNFVFGEASPHLRATIISIHRLHQSTYGLPQDEGLYRKRLLTEAVHELGHTFGSGHCSNPHCVMFFSNTLADTDTKGPHFCEKCLAKLKLK